jgi:hypothetical protein
METEKPKLSTHDQNTDKSTKLSIFHDITIVESEQTRWFEFQLRFIFKIVYKWEKQLSKPDALEKRP